MKANGPGNTRNHRVGLSAACGHRISSLACRLVAGEEEKSYLNASEGQSESLNTRMILAHSRSFTSTVAVPIFHLRQVARDVSVIAMLVGVSLI